MKRRSTGTAWWDLGRFAEATKDSERATYVGDDADHDTGDDTDIDADEDTNDDADDDTKDGGRRTATGGSRIQILDDALCRNIDYWPCFVTK